MKLSVSLPEDDIAFLDTYMRDQGIATRSAVLQHAVSLLRNALLEMAYADAWEEWDEAPDAGLWHGVSADGLAAISDGARV